MVVRAPLLTAFFFFAIVALSRYQFYDRERYGVVDSFEPPVGSPSVCGDQGSGADTVLPCVFPFSHRNVT